MTRPGPRPEVSVKIAPGRSSAGFPAGRLGIAVTWRGRGGALPVPPALLFASLLPGGSRVPWAVIHVHWSTSSTKDDLPIREVTKLVSRRDKIGISSLDAQYCGLSFTHFLLILEFLIYIISFQEMDARGTPDWLSWWSISFRLISCFKTKRQKPVLYVLYLLPLSEDRQTGIRNLTTMLVFYSCFCELFQLFKEHKIQNYINLCSHSSWTKNYSCVTLDQSLNLSEP
ncbi:uncharacterized protein LOC115293463 [Suricata suricatta]|uniref:uncharacterized protein LOC115293463 n=1 Tax=Suricata suricatta TaxID=37032 RepID=UPI001155F9E0|nr:uncharacterized protein LOC115293463 [Suricata suricatta]